MCFGIIHYLPSFVPVCNPQSAIRNPQSAIRIPESAYFSRRI
ncbi:MAG: hypothetical protein QME81_12490 [bacterium]|nr:hypothetical protein [bacterium]